MTVETKAENAFIKSFLGRLTGKIVIFMVYAKLDSLGHMEI